MRTMKQMIRSSATILTALVALLGAGCAADGTRQEAAFERNIQRTKQALIAAGDADSLAAAAMLVERPKDEPLERLALMSRAVTAAPDRADLIWLNLQLCSQVDSCDPTPIEAQLHAVDPTNGAAWSLLIGRSAKVNDTASVRNIMVAIASAKRFDIYWNTMIAHATNAFIKVRMLDSRTALMTTIGFAAATAIPAYQHISNACKGDNLKDPEVVQTCQRVSAVMRQGDTYITEMIGVAIAKRVWPEGNAQYLDAVNAGRLAHYRMGTQAKTSIAMIRSDKYAEKHLQLLATHRSEQEVVLAELLGAGLNPSPPTGWIDKAGS